MNQIDPLSLPLTAPITLRLEGRPADVALLSAALAAVFHVTNESRDYANRKGDRVNVRRYLTIIGVDDK